MLTVTKFNNNYMTYATRKYYIPLVSNFFTSVQQVKYRIKDNAIPFKISSDHKVREVYATTTSSVSADDTVTSRITSNYCNPSCSPVYSNKTKLQHCML